MNSLLNGSRKWESGMEEGKEGRMEEKRKSDGEIPDLMSGDAESEQMFWYSLSRLPPWSMPAGGRALHGMADFFSFRICILGAMNPSEESFTGRSDATSRRHTHPPVRSSTHPIDNECFYYRQSWHGMGDGLKRKETGTLGRESRQHFSR